jgi:hypothetical protein
MINGNDKVYRCKCQARGQMHFWTTLGQTHAPSRSVQRSSSTGHILDGRTHAAIVDSRSARSDPEPTPPPAAHRNAALWNRRMSSAVAVSGRSFQECRESLAGADMALPRGHRRASVCRMALPVSRGAGIPSWLTTDLDGTFS